MTITAALLQTRFPALASLAPDILNDAIDEAYRLHDPVILGSLLDDAVKYYAAMVALVGGAGAAAIAAGVASATAGPVSISFHSTGSSNPIEAANTFGSMYNEILIRRVPGFLTV